MEKWVMTKKKILFVCTANYYRSVTAEELFKNKQDLVVKSAGTHPQAVKVINKEFVEWADIIFVMEEHHKEYITENFGSVVNKIIVLHIPDIYFRGDPRLIKMLEEKVGPYLEKKSLIRKVK